MIAIVGAGICYYEIFYLPFTPLKFDDRYGFITLPVNNDFYQKLP